MFLGYESVLEDMEKQPKRTTATLARGPSFVTTVAYANAYVAPVGSTTGHSGDGYPAQTTTATLWQLGESYAPRVDDQLTVAGNIWLIVAVRTRLNGDSGYAAHDCTVADKV